MYAYSDKIFYWICVWDSGGRPISDLSSYLLCGILAAVFMVIIIEGWEVRG